MTNQSKRNKADDGEKDNSVDANLTERLSSLDKRLNSINQERETKEKPPEQQAINQNAVAQAFRLSAEFVSGVLAGGAIGWLVDKLFGSAPWGLIVFLLLGFCAGMLNLLRASGALKTMRLKDKP
ncbi:AtpZ/AtpI family protein [Microvirga sp. W0021]|uniref:ATP synthase protein I n=1 Tax=Hohaiivirga grylli TaxID=3133970 RepID=A0ABV0BI61_9HYPH